LIAFLLFAAEGLHEMEQGVVKLGSRLSGSPEAVGFFFYAEHGIQSEGRQLPYPGRLPGQSLLLGQVRQPRTHGGGAASVGKHHRLRALYPGKGGILKTGRKGLIIIGYCLIGVGTEKRGLSVERSGTFVFFPFLPVLKNPFFNSPPREFTLDNILGVVYS
jgi:hypothetical protein